MSDGGLPWIRRSSYWSESKAASRDGVGHQLLGLCELVRVGGVERIAEVLQGSAHRLAQVIEHRDLPRVLLLSSGSNTKPQVCGTSSPTTARSTPSPVVPHWYGTEYSPSGSNGKLAGEAIGQVVEVRHRIRVDRGEQALLDHDRHHVVGRHDDVEARSLLHPSQHLLVRRVEVLGDRHVELLLERADQLGIDVLAPVVEREVAVGFAGLAPPPLRHHLLSPNRRRRHPHPAMATASAVSSVSSLKRFMG